MGIRSRSARKCSASERGPCTRGDATAMLTLNGAPYRCAMSNGSIRGPYGPRSRSLADARSRHQQPAAPELAEKGFDVGGHVVLGWHLVALLHQAAQLVAVART